MAHRADPALSVVVVSFSPPALVSKCLDALVASGLQNQEILIVRRSGDEIDAVRTLADGVTGCRLLEAGDGATVPRMRHLGVAASCGSIVALIEDDCVVEHGWGAAVVRAHRTPHVAVGGAVEPSSFDRALDWAAFLCDYARFMLPLPGGEAQVLPGNNVSYKRSVVPELLGLTAERGLQETFVHDAWARAGVPMKVEPGIVVRNVHAWRLEDLCVVPFHHGRAFAGQRSRAWPVVRRLLYMAGSLALPVLQTGRILGRVLSRRRFFWPMLRALPYVAVFATCWSAGECAGYALGSGSSLDRWR